MDSSAATRKNTASCSRARCGHSFSGPRVGNPGTIGVMNAAASDQSRAFVHEAFLYRDPEEFLRGTLEFVRGGVEADEPVFVVLNAEKIARLREALGEDAHRVLFADMAEVGANPARIIAAWHDFVDAHGASGRPIRGIGEPIWAGRSDSELAECHRHEELLNLAFADTPAFRLLCPYDVSALDPSVVEEAERTHPFMSDVEPSRKSGTSRGPKPISAPFANPLEAPPASAARLTFDADSLGELRELVIERA